jgi:hypothetical protein
MSDNIVINTTTETVNLQVSSVTDTYSLSVLNVEGPTRWGLIVGSLSAQTDLYSYLSHLTFPYLFGSGIRSIQPTYGNNIASGDYSTILGGQNNNTNNLNSTFIIGSNITAISANFTYVENLSSQNSVYSPTLIGQGKEVILSDGGSNLGNGDYSLSLNFRNGVYTDSLITNSLTSSEVVGSSTEMVISDGGSDTSHGEKTLSLNFQNGVYISNDIHAAKFYGDGSGLTGVVATSSFTPLTGNWQSTYATVSSLSGNWNNTATAYQNTSGTFVTNTLLQSTSAFLTPLTLTNTLTSQLLPTSVYQSTSGSFATNTTLSTLSFNQSTNTLSVSGITNVSLSSLAYSNTNVSNSYLTIQQFAASNPTGLAKGYTVTLYNGRVYVFAGTNSSDPNQYLQLNANPHTPFYVVIPLSATSPVAVDNFYLGDFKSAKYEFQITNNYDNNIYYSEINVLGSIGTSTGVASEYGQIATAPLINGYDVNVSGNQLYLNVYFNTTPGSQTLILRGLRTNFHII